MYKRQIETILRLNSDSKHNFNGVLAMDELPKTRQKGSYVINLDDHDEPGSHWVAVWCDNEKVEYMDPFGLPPLDDRCLLFLGGNVRYNTVKMQLLLSNACGFYCVYFVIKRASGLAANSIIETLRRTDSDYVVKDYVYSRYKPIFN